MTANQLPCVTRCVTRSRALAQGRLEQAEYHLSLSRTVAVRKHQIQPLLADLRRCLAGTPRRAAGSTLCRLVYLCAITVLRDLHKKHAVGSCCLYLGTESW